MTATASQWRDLFAGTATPAQTVRLRVVQKRGREFLILPINARAAVAALELYPAQTSRARAARLLLKCFLATGFAPGTHRTEVPVSMDAPLVRFIRQFEGRESLPPFAILAGNPAAPGRRFLVALFDDNGTPRRIIKAGLEPDAHALVRHESNILKQIQTAVPAAPRWQAEFTVENFEAFATEFISGPSPHSASPDQLSRQLTPWLDLKTTVLVQNLPAWQRLRAVCRPSEEFRLLESRCCQRTILPALYHGDFAPWNIKEDASGNWRIVDWERGEFQGPPAWDWFHYVTQPLFLVSKSPVDTAVQSLEDHLASDPFQRYAAAAQVREFLSNWYWAYLLYSRHVLVQTEQVARLDALLNLLREGRALKRFTV